MVASTNHLDKLDSGLSSRPSRFDRKYLFPLPSEEERDLYCQYWRSKLKKKEVDIEFPAKICPAVAIITDGFSFAYLQEAFVATLLAIAGRRSEVLDEESENVGESKDINGENDDKDLNEYELWREIKKTVKALRDDMGKIPDKSGATQDAFAKAFALEKEAQAPTDSTESTSSGQLTVPPHQLDTTLEINSENMPKALTVRGKSLKVDYQHVPMITEQDTFVYGSEQGTQ